MRKYLDKSRLRYVLKKMKEKLDLKADKAELAVQSNPNLLDNWYFVGGGSQQGGGQFPINQKGQTEYTTAGYKIDRWIGNGTLTCKVTDEGIIIATKSISGNAFWQNTGINLGGKTVTLSVLFASNRLVSGTVVANSNVADGQTAYQDESVQIYIGNGGEPAYTYFAIRPNREKLEAEPIVAAKLELGDHQTLAHQDAEGNWVLNDPPPDYGTELAKCQRYFVRLYPARSAFCFGVFIAYSATSAYGTIPLPVSIRAKPVVTLNGTFRLFGGHAASIGEIAGITSSFVSIVVSSSNLTIGNAYYLENSENVSYIDIDANL